MANRLIDEQSPYLLQHAHNPVDWYPWGDEAFLRAAKERKPVLVSIGYAACHWCHVMERESFENDDVAAYMNEHFINIKVDREEHPDVDHLYMDAVQAISGSGGWPLNVFVTPERIPFYGGTYYPPRAAYNRVSWTHVLERINEVWTKQPDEILSQSNQMLQYLKQVSVPATSDSSKWDKSTCVKMTETLLQQADTVFGGFGRAPKFPATMSISYLLEHHHFTRNEAALDHALHSLDAMIKGGIYDQLGGGFARYSTDEKWLAPHFEKMLYDNALLVMVLCDAYSLTKKQLYRDVIEETIAFAERELTHSSGGFYSALDADSEGVEGKFYTWTWDEWVALFGGNDEVLMAYFGIEKEGNWEQTNILHIAAEVENISARTGLQMADIEARITNAKADMLEARNRRERPLTDDKSLLSWNALMNIALCKAANALSLDTYATRAEQHMQWMLDSFRTGDGLKHVWKNGQARIDANLDDYAYLIQALLQLASVTGNFEWMTIADELAGIVMENFIDESGTFFYYTSARQRDIPVRKIDLYDGATPSANAVMAHNLLLLGICMERSSFHEQAYVMLQKMAGSVLRYPSSFGYWAALLQRYAEEQKVVVSTGNGAENMHEELRSAFLPHAYILMLRKEIFIIPLLSGKFLSGEPRIFVCTTHSCLPPASNTGGALRQITG